MSVDRDALTLRQMLDAGEAILEFTRGGRKSSLRTGERATPS